MSKPSRHLLLTLTLAFLPPLWPLANFLAHNRDLPLNVLEVGLAAMFSLAAAVLLGGVIWTIQRRRVPFAVAWAGGGVASAGLLSFAVVEDACRVFGLPPGSELWIWLAAWLLLIMAAVRLIPRPAVLNASAIAAAVATAIPSVQYGVHVIRGRATVPAAVDVPAPAGAGTVSSALPNVYYFVLDMYSRGDNLERFYGYDNRTFLQALEQRGFRVLARSHSNHHATRFSMTTTLYMDHVIPVLVDGVPVSRDPVSATPLLRDGIDLLRASTRGRPTEPIVWRPYGDNRVEREGTGVRIVGLGGRDGGQGARTFFARPAHLTSDLVPGRPYRLNLWGRPSAGAAIQLVLSNGGSVRTSEGREVTGGRREYQFEFEATAGADPFLRLQGLGANESFVMERVELHPFLESPVVDRLARVSFDMQVTPQLFDAYLGSSQHLSPVLRTFRDLGYQVLFANLSGTPTDGCDPYCIFGQEHLSMQAIELLDMTPALAAIRFWRPHVWRAITTRFQKDPADVVRKIPASVPTPHFLLAHILSPHPPYIYTADCGVRDDFIYELDPDAWQVRDIREMYPYYLDQLTCVNSRIQEAVDLVLERDPGAIIVVQSDHGAGKVQDRSDGEAIEARYGILNAMRMPAPCLAHAYDEMSSVNTFRLVFACLAGGTPNYVPDRMLGPPEGMAAREITAVEH